MQGWVENCRGMLERCILNITMNLKGWGIMRVIVYFILKAWNYVTWPKFCQKLFLSSRVAMLGRLAITGTIIYATSILINFSLKSNYSTKVLRDKSRYYIKNNSPFQSVYQLTGLCFGGISKSTVIQKQSRDSIVRTLIKICGDDSFLLERPAFC